MEHARKTKGFTLIELLIVIAIVGIIASVALPSYSSYLLSSRRTDATIALRSAAQQLERCRTESFTYANCATPDTSPQKYYDLTYTPTPTATTYTITATPKSSKSQANDSNCAKFILQQDGLGLAENSTGTAAPDCW